MHVTKMHGARNDFLIVDGRNYLVENAASFARWACDRRAGVGADGMIVLERSQTADVRMRTINADGSEAEMCGNGIRCAARWLDENGEGDAIAFETDGGIVRTEVIAREPEYAVRVAMRRPKVGAIAIAVVPDATFVDVGNPHVVILRENAESIDLERAAEALKREPLLRGGVNVQAASLRGSNAVNVRHWERGVGLTEACGTGAVACAAVAVARRLARAPVELFVPGGRLVVDFDEDGTAYLTGPAARVFDTEVELGVRVLP
ncbi:MAG TPA: diaminopimelate epimerase [Candidatus Cybelea sp.]|jgi:diaminopimelate epimerase|nr:diaminopimelate epimerase [Candidatus Cybelea sp.]